MLTIKREALPRRIDIQSKDEQDMLELVDVHLGEYGEASVGYIARRCGPAAAAWALRGAAGADAFARKLGLEYARKVAVYLVPPLAVRKYLVHPDANDLLDAYLAVKKLQVSDEDEVRRMCLLEALRCTTAEAVYKVYTLALLAGVEADTWFWPHLVGYECSVIRDKKKQAPAESTSAVEAEKPVGSSATGESYLHVGDIPPGVMEQVYELLGKVSDLSLERTLGPRAAEFSAMRKAKNIPDYGTACREREQERLDSLDLPDGFPPPGKRY